MSSETGLPQVSREYHHKVFDTDRWKGFQPRNDDIFICTAYKAGTTWTQNICALLVFQDPVLPKPLGEITPWMEIRTVDVEITHALYEAQEHRRFIKTHTPLDGLPWFNDCSYIFVARDPRDVFCSMVNHIQNHNIDAEADFVREMKAEGPPPDMPEEPNELFDMWCNTGAFEWEADGFPFWSMMHHAQTFWRYRHLPNMHVVHYSDLLADLNGEMRAIAAFLDITVPEEKWPALVDAATFSSMKKNADRYAPETQFKMWNDNARFFNKGVSGQYKELLSAESIARFDEIMNERYDPAMMNWLKNGKSAL